MTQARYIGYNGAYLEINAPESQTVSASNIRFTKVTNFGVANPGSETETGGINVTGWLTSTRSPVNGTHVPNKSWTDATYVARWDRTEKLNSSPSVDSILRFNGVTTEVIPMTDFGRDIISYATPEALSSAKKIPLVDKTNIFTTINTFNSLKIDNPDLDGNNGKLGKNVVSVTDGFTIVGIKPNNDIARRVTIEGDFVVNGNLNLKNGKKIWHEDNDGHTSGLDADTIDGHEWSEITAIQDFLQGQINQRLRRDVNDLTTFKLTSGYLTIDDSTTNQAAGQSVMFMKNNTDTYSLLQIVSGSSYHLARADSNAVITPISGKHPMSLDLLTGNVVFAGDVTGFSDRRLKKNITPIIDALDLINKINPVWFDWEVSGKTDIGVIAQEVEEDFPDFVAEDPTTGLKTVKYMKFIPLLLAAVKELAKK